MLHRASEPTRPASDKSRVRRSRRDQRRRGFLSGGRRPRIEQLEARQVLDATLHSIAAANINVVQNDEGNTAASVTVTTAYSVNDYGLRTGSNRGDYNVQIGPSAADDIAGGILLTSINQNGRDNGEALPLGTQYGIPSVHDDSPNGYFIAVHNTARTGVATADAGVEYNFNVASAYFPYADGWIGGIARDATRVNGDPNDTWVGSPQITIGTHYINAGGGQSTVNLTSLGINSQTDGVLIVNHGKNENNFALSRANADGTWTAFTKGHNQNTTSYEQDPVAFVYIPKSETRVVSGKFLGAGAIAMQSAPFTLTKTGTGTYHLEIPGYAPNQGVLIISAEGGAGANTDNVVSYQVNGNGWDIQSRDLPSADLEDVEAANAVASFVFIPGPVMTITPTSALETTENATTATFQIVLQRQPTADVTIALSSSDTTEGTLSASSVTFTAANWNVPQTITVTGVNDADSDGDVVYSIVTGPVTSADPQFAGISLNDVSLTNRDNEPRLTLSPGFAFYNPGSPGQIIDPEAKLAESLATSYDGYQLTVSVSANADANDRLEIRNYGTAAGQVGVSGSNVSYGGTAVATFTGGNGSTPLTITFNSASTPAIVQAVVRAITFRNLLSNPSQAARTATFVVSSPSGQSSGAVTRGVQVGLVHVTDLQNGVDRNYGVYSGQVDIQIWQQNPDTLYPTGDSVSGVLVDAPASGGTEASQILLKYNNLFGSGPGQIPLGATIVSAELLVNVNNPGQGSKLHRMLAPWSDTTDTWNTFGNGSFPRNTNGGVQLDDIEARSTQESEWGTSAGGGTSNTGIVSIGVTQDLAAWSSGAVNEGWLFDGWPLRTDGTAFSPGEAADPFERPRLKVVWLPPVVQEGTFRQGVNGYNGTVDTTLRQSQPGVTAGTEFTLSVTAQSNAQQQSLLLFDDIIGTGAGQIPPGSYVHAAVLTLASTTTNAQGSGGRFVPMLQTWDIGATWDSFTEGINTDGIEAATTFTAQAGTASLAALVQGGLNPFDVTTDVQAWVKGTTANNGWAILPWPGGNNDWFVGAGDMLVENSRPQLRVFFTTPGVTITPTTGLTTSETGGTATFTVKLDTAPTADVTIPLSSSDATEGTVAPTALTFTPQNWNIPQTVTITGVDDGLADGEIAYSILTGPIASSDPFYNNFDPADVGVTNSDNEVAGVTVFPGSGLVTTEAGGTATFTLVLNTMPAANVTIGLSSSDVTEGTVSAPVVFTSANWNTPQTVTVTGVNDFEIDGDIAYTIITANATSTDPNYNNLAVADVSVTNRDNDVAGVTFTPSSGLKTTEAGGTATFTAVLNAQPTADVTFSLSTSNFGEGTVAPGLLTFTASNWNVPQTVTITGVDDFQVAYDGGVDYAIITGAIASSDTNYNGLNPIDVTATNVDVRPVVTLPEGTKHFGFGGPAVLLDFQATVVDLDSANLNTGTLTVQATSGGTADDRIEVRNYGTGPGQIGVSGANVTFGGMTIGALAGGMGTTPLVITFNTNSTPAAAQALLRAVTFRNVSSTFSNSVRTIQVALVDEAGHTTSPVSRTMIVGMQRETAFQNGSDFGNGAYSGTADIELSQANPTTAYPLGSTPDGLVVVGSAGTADSQVLLKFDSIFGNGPGQIPFGAIITSANLDLNVTTSGNGPVFRRLLVPFNANTDTWSSLTGGIQADNTEARTAIDSTLNTAGGNAANTGSGMISVGVAADLQAWSNGEANNGWAMMPFGTANVTPFTFSPSEAGVVAQRPKLRVEWIPAGAGNTALRQGENGYTGAVDTVLNENSPAATGGGTVDLFTDYSAGTASNLATHVLLQFTNMIGTGTNQIPAGTKVYAAVLTLPSMGGTNTPGDGGSLRTVMQPWTDAATWGNSFGGNGLQADGFDLSLVETGRAGNETRNPNAQAGYNTFDVTFDVQAWLDGTAANNGWGFLPWTGGTDGWAISSSETANIANRPKLTVYYEPLANIAPVNTVPAGPIAGTEDTNVPFSAGNAITISDADAGTNSITTTISVTDTSVGTFTATSGGGTATATPSNGGATMTIVGTLTQVNLALGTLVYVPAANRDTTSGTTTVTVVTSDGVASDTDSFNITLTPVNDAPSFTAGADQTVAFNVPLQNIPNWATAISAGPNELSQIVTFSVSNNNNSLFSSQPAIASNGTLTFTPATGMSGTAVVTVFIQDNGGTANGGVNQSATQTFNITVNAGANATPTINTITFAAINEDASLQTVNFSGVTAGAAESQALTVTATSDNTALIPNPAVSYTSPNATGSMSFTPVANQSGTATITFTVRDAGIDGNPGNGDDASFTTTFTVTVNAVNDRPTFTAANPPAVAEDALAQSITGWVTAFNPGPNEGSQVVSAYTVSNISNPALFTAVPAVANNGTLTYTPAANASGTATFDLTVTDNGGTANGGIATSLVQTFTITINAANDLPTITAIGNVTIDEDAGLQTVNFSGVTAGGGETQGLTITTSSSNPALVPNPTVNYTSPSATGSLTFTPAANSSGTSTITVTVRDTGLDLIPGNSDDGSTVVTFTVTVNSVNDVPVFAVGANQTVNEDAAAQTIPGFMTGISAGANESGQTLQFNVTGNTISALFAAGPSISPTGVLTYTPAANANGTAIITVTLSDNGGTANGGVNTSAPQSFTITINAVNDPPSFTVGADQTVAYNSPAQTVPGWATAIFAGASNESGQNLTFNVTGNTVPTLFSVQPTIANNGTLAFTPAPGQQGTATITVQLTDDGGTANSGVNVSTSQTFTITIDPPVNNPPTLNPLNPITISEDAAQQTVNLSGITAGGSDVQDLQLTVSSSNPALIPTPLLSYASPGAIGSLAFTPVANGSGSAVISVTVRDAGLDLILGNSDDGSLTRTFNVDVTPVNDAPVANDSVYSIVTGTTLNGNLSAIDVDNPSLTYTVNLPPVLGVLTLNPTSGAFTYTPNLNATGLEVITFTVSDGTLTDAGVLRITILPVTPVVTAENGDIHVIGTDGPDTVIVTSLANNMALVRTQSPGFAASAVYPLTGLLTINTGAGADTIELSNLSSSALIDAGPDNDYVSGSTGNDTIIGGLGADQINASRGDNIVWGDVINEQDLAVGGPDILSALGGNDVMYGGGGNDQLFPGAGNDFVNAGQGNDVVSGGDGDDRIFGGLGNDTLSGDAGHDVISGNGGNDQLLGRDGNDLLIGGAGGLADSLSGGGGSDVLVASDLTNGFASSAGSANDLALIALLNSWNTTHAGGLVSSLLTGDDGVADVLEGAIGDDDFYLSAADLTPDLNVSGMGTDRSFN